MYFHLSYKAHCARANGIVRVIKNISERVCHACISGKEFQILLSISYWISISLKQIIRAFFFSESEHGRQEANRSIRANKERGRGQHAHYQPSFTHLSFCQCSITRLINSENKTINLLICSYFGSMESIWWHCKAQVACISMPWSSVKFLASLTLIKNMTGPRADIKCNFYNIFAISSYSVMQNMQVSPFLDGIAIYYSVIYNIYKN